MILAKELKTEPKKAFFYMAQLDFLGSLTVSYKSEFNQEEVAKYEKKRQKGKLLKKSDKDRIIDWKIKNLLNEYLQTLPEFLMQEPEGKWAGYFNQLVEKNKINKRELVEYFISNKLPNTRVSKPSEEDLEDEDKRAFIEKFILGQENEVLLEKINIGLPKDTPEIIKESLNDINFDFIDNKQEQKRFLSGLEYLREKLELNYLKIDGCWLYHKSNWKNIHHLLLFMNEFAEYLYPKTELSSFGKKQLDVHFALDHTLWGNYEKDEVTGTFSRYKQKIKICLIAEEEQSSEICFMHEYIHFLDSYLGEKFDNIFSLFSETFEENKKDKIQEIQKKAPLFFEKFINLVNHYKDGLQEKSIQCIHTEFDRGQSKRYYSKLSETLAFRLSHILKQQLLSNKERAVGYSFEEKLFVNSTSSQEKETELSLDLLGAITNKNLKKLKMV